MCQVYEGTAVGSPYAIVCCIAGTVCNGAMMSFSGKLLSEKLDVLRLAFYTAPVSLGVLLPIFYLQEVVDISSSAPPVTHAIMSLGSCACFASLLSRDGLG